MKVLITGASGLLGRAIHQACLEKGYDTRALAFSRSDPSKGLIKLDLTDAASVIDLLQEFNPDVVIHSAAERRPDVVENDPQASHAINVEVPGNLAKAVMDLSATPPLLINLSTDYVFDGSKPPYKVDDEPNPLNSYGVSKLQGERAVATHAKPNHYTNFRVPVLYGKAPSNNESAVNVLLDAIMPSAGSNQPQKCDAYAVRYPTCVNDVALALVTLADVFVSQGETKSIPPITHFSAKEAMTKYDMCLVLSRVANSIGFHTRTEHLDPEYDVNPLAATSRPRHCKLDTNVLENLGIHIQNVSFEDWWRQYLTEKWEEKLKQEAILAAEAKEKRRKEEEDRKKRQEEEAERQRKVDEEKRKKEEEETEAAEKEAKRKAEEEEGDDGQAAKEVEESNDGFQEGPTTSTFGHETDQASLETTLPPQSTATTTTQEVLIPTSQTDPSSGGPLQRSSVPGSPNPSFSSLQARPTPPATSALSSPVTSQPSSSINGVTPGWPSHDGTEQTPQPFQEATNVTSTPTPSSTPFAVESPLNLANAQLRSKRPNPIMERTLSASSARLSSLTDESNLFGGTLKPLNLQKKPISEMDGDNDSDSYGQPSPRGVEQINSLIPSRDETSLGGNDSTDITDTATATATAGGSPAAFRSISNGGPAPYGLDSTSSNTSDSITNAPRGSDDVQVPSNTHATAVAAGDVATPKPQLYHRPSFDEARLAREHQELERNHNKSWDFTIRVGDPQKVGDPMTAHIVYTVRTISTCPNFRSSQFSVLRRYRDFRWLHAALVHNNPGVIVPPVPEKVALGRFAAELIEARRIGLETCINKIAQHPLLQRDDDFRLFLESDNFAVDVKQRDLIKGPIITPEQKTYKSWGSAITAVSSAVSSSSSHHKFHEFDEWFEQQKIYLDSLESNLKQMVKTISAVSNQRKDLAHAINELSNVLMTLSGSSLSRSLSTCFAGLAELQKRAGELEDMQAEVDVRQVGTVMYEYERVVGSVRKAFATRIDAWHVWQKSEDELRKHRNKFEKIKTEVSSSSSPQFNSMLSEVSELEAKTLERKREFDEISNRCKIEMDRTDIERVQDFQNVIESWVDGMMERQEELIQEWENYINLLSRQTGQSVEQILHPFQEPSPQQQQQIQNVRGE